MMSINGEHRLDILISRRTNRYGKGSCFHELPLNRYWRQYEFSCSTTHALRTYETEYFQQHRPRDKLLVSRFRSRGKHCCRARTPSDIRSSGSLSFSRVRLVQWLRFQGGTPRKV